MNNHTLGALALAFSLSCVSTGSNAALVGTEFRTELSMSRVNGSFVLDTFNSLEFMSPESSWSATGSVSRDLLWASGTGSANYSNDSYTLSGSVKASGEWPQIVAETQRAHAKLWAITDQFDGPETILIEGIFNIFSAAEIDEGIPTGAENSLGSTIYSLSLLKKSGQGFVDTGLINPITPGTLFSQTLSLDPGLYRLEALISANVSGRGINGSFGWGGGSMDVTIMDVSAVPVPAAVWLFGSGLLGLIGIARRKAA